MFLFHLIVNKPQKVFVGAYGRHSFWMRVVKMSKVAAFSPLVLKSNIFEEIKYSGTFNIRQRMLIHFDNFEISTHEELYIRISMILTTVPVKERYCTNSPRASNMFIHVVEAKRFEGTF